MVTDRRPPENDRFAGESFTFRRMKPWQIWSIGGVAVATALILILYAL